MRVHAALIALAGLLITACREEPENIQAKTEETMDRLENRAGEIAREAENVTDEAVKALDSQSAILANQVVTFTDGNEAQPVNKQ